MSKDLLIDEEVPFEQGRFLYTRTDRRGVILSANSLFVSISDYSPDEVVGAPHKLVRHPLMPKGVFHLMWQTLQSGNPFTGFVRNRARDGRYYWVCAIASPSDTGYLSVRTPPRGKHFDQARDIYGKMLVAERNGATPAQSAQLFIDLLREEGHATLDDFMAELLADHAVEPGRADCPVDRIRTLRADLSRLADTQTELLATLQKLYLIPTNMRILASRLEPSGGPVSAISDSYKRAASELMVRLHRPAAPSGGPDANRGAGVEVRAGAELMSRALFLISATTILARAEAQFVNEPEVSRVDHKLERSTLSNIVKGFEALADESTSAVATNVDRIGKEAEHIKRLMAGLDQIRILGEVESGRIRNADGGLAAIMSQLTSFHGLIHTRLTAMSNAAARMHLERA